MPQSLVKNFVHITFSTKYREHLIKKAIQEELFYYLGGICKDVGSHPIIVGGFTDHVHLLVSLSRKISLMELIERLKTHSSKWIKKKSTLYRNFYWQRGYGCFSVNPHEADVVKRYIENQENHHTRRNFQDEYRALLKKYGVEYDERYVWD